MNEKQETIADIIASKRRHAAYLRQTAPSVPNQRRRDAMLDEARYTYEEADRLEAALKREKAALEANALSAGGLVEAMRQKKATAEKSSAVVNAAKLREVMCEILSYVESFHKYITPGKGKRPTALFAVADTIRDKARAALAAPARNCDLARDWIRDLYAHFQPPASVKREMPPEWVDAVMAFCRWLVAPATEKEGGAK